jgi:RNA exonuclease 4
VLTVKGEQVCRVSVVNYFGNVVLDTLIQPSRVVMDYRTDITGIKPQELKNGEDFLTVTMRVRIA